MNLIEINPQSDLTKPKLNAMATQLKQAILDGDTDPVSAWIHLKAIQDILKEVQADPLVIDAVKQAIDKYDSKNPDDARMHGAKFEMRNRADRWDFSNDDEWVTLEIEVEQIKIKMKARELILKGFYASGINTDAETGEVVNVSKEAGGQSIVITLGK